MFLKEDKRRDKGNKFVIHIALSRFNLPCRCLPII